MNNQTTEQSSTVGKVMQPTLLQRATDLHDKAFMPWAQAEAQAISEADISEDQIDSLIAEAHPNAGLETLLSQDELREFARGILVHGSGLLSDAAPLPQPPSALQPSAPEDGWIPWEEKPEESPVPDGTPVIVKLRDGSILERESFSSMWQPHYSRNESRQITAYRLAQPHKEQDHE